MSHISNLGRVKGDKGKVYTPKVQVNTEGTGVDVTWELKDELESEPEDFSIIPKVYIPSIQDGYLTFTLGDASISSITGNTGRGYYIKGDKGDNGEVNTAVVTQLPPSPQEGIIYIHNGIAKVYDEETESFYELDNLGKFSEYYTQDEIDADFYSKSEVDGLLGSISRCQQEILYTLDKESVNIRYGD